MNKSLCRQIKSKLSPQDVLARVSRHRFPVLLESSQAYPAAGRYSFVASDPFLTFTFDHGRCEITRDGQTTILKQDPLVVLRDLLTRYRLKGLKRNGPPFLCGAVGFFSYDYGFYLERFHRRHKEDLVVPLIWFGFYDCVGCLDHKTGRWTIFSSGFPERGAHRKNRSRQRLEDFLANVTARPPAPSQGCAASSPSRVISSDMDRILYRRLIDRVHAYIRRGDIYQVNIARRFETTIDCTDEQLYGRLTRQFPVPFSAFLKTPRYSILSGSPELFVRFDGRLVTTRPMKGTRPRSGRSVYDRLMREELKSSAKEKAELLMIVDLERNDLGRVCRYGSIRVGPRRIEPYATVFQATADVSGVLKKGCDRLDIIRACFPGGSVIGCPKIRAMEIIEELEPHGRSIYTGSLGYLSFHNTMQFNMLIRTFLKLGPKVIYHTGGGIVIDSDAEAEFEETEVKARVLVNALMGEQVR